MLQNPGPKDDDIDNIMREVLDLQDVECCGDDMCEQDPLEMDIPTMSVRETVLHSLKQINVVKNHDLVHDILPGHLKEEYLKHLKEIENMTIKCLELSYSLPNPHVDDDPVPSTSGVNTKAASN